MPADARMSAAPPEETPLIRFRWLKRIALGVVAMLLLMLLTRTVAAALVARQWRAFEADMARDGIPTRIEQIQRPPVPAADDAAPLWRQAFAALNPNIKSPRSSGHGSDEFGRYPPYWPLWHQLANRSAGVNAAAFALADQARRLPGADWGMNVGGINGAWNEMRALSNTLDDDAERNFILNRHDLAADRLLASFALARHARVDAMLVAQLVGMGIDCLTCDALRRHVGTMQVGKGPISVRTEQLRDVIAALLDPTRGSSLQRAASNEVAAFVRDSERVVSNSWLSRPILDADRHRILRMSANIAYAARLRPGNARDALLPTVEDATPFRRISLEATLNRPSRALSELYNYRSGRFIRTADQTVAITRVAAMALAVRWYQLDHGTFPPTLDALVPAYLPAVPVNPMSRTGAAFEYVILPHALPDGGDRPMLKVDFGFGAMPATPPMLPEYEFYGDPSLDSRANATHGRWSDLTSWTPTSAMIREADAAEAAR